MGNACSDHYEVDASRFIPFEGGDLRGSANSRRHLHVLNESMLGQGLANHDTYHDISRGIDLFSNECLALETHTLFGS